MMFKVPVRAILANLQCFHLLTVLTLFRLLQLCLELIELTVSEILT